MNKREIEQNRVRSLDMIKQSSRYGTRINSVKCWKGTSKLHWTVLSSIVWKLINEYDFEVITEAEFIGGGRCDIFVIDNNGNGSIIEVLNSETEERLLAKKEVYPFPIHKVYTKDFNIEKWEL